ncbi:MAG TPA: hypothetical protein VJN96_16630 [Vicinamibacterales bacterium]|nr:hypothetical protein [Vicinamibacterales bacterium]
MARSRILISFCVALLAVAVLAIASVHAGEAEGQAAPKREDLACRLLPIAEAEALYGAKAAVPPGAYYNSGAGAVCMVSIADGAFVRVVSAAPGASGIASTVQGQLAALRSQIPTSAKVETRDYGDVGCLGITFTGGPDGRSYDKPIYETLCLQLTGGYLLLHMASGDAKIVSDEHVKALLAKAAEKRKGLQ